MARAGRMASPSSLLAVRAVPRSAVSFSTSRRNRGDIGKDKTHATDKKGGHKDVQSEASKSAHDERASESTASQATSEKDTGNNNQRAKDDHPAAPKPVIGMNDERGAKGH